MAGAFYGTGRFTPTSMLYSPNLMGIDRRSSLTGRWQELPGVLVAQRDKQEWRGKRWVVSLGDRLEKPSRRAATRDRPLPTPPRNAFATRRRWPRGCGRARWMSSLARATLSAPAVSLRRAIQADQLSSSSSAAAGHGQDNAGDGHRQQHPQPLYHHQRRAGRGQGDSRGYRGCPRAARTVRPAHHALRRRVTAGTRRSKTPCCPMSRTGRSSPHRRDDGEPHFEVNKAPRQPQPHFQLRPLTEEDPRAIAVQALNDSGTRLRHAEGDAKKPAALDHLVWTSPTATPAACSTPWNWLWKPPPDENGVIAIDPTRAEESIQRRAVL